MREFDQYEDTIRGYRLERGKEEGTYGSDEWEENE